VSLSHDYRGGGRIKNTETGGMIRDKDASDTAANIRAVMNAYQNKSLVAVIAGKHKATARRSGQVR
jgi:hypothetical protein